MAEGAVFVVGAGASADFRLPVGGELKKMIGVTCDILGMGDEKHGDADWFRLLSVCANVHNANDSDIKQYADASRAIARGMPLSISIDNFLHTRQGDDITVRIGKLAIAKLILQAERASNLFTDDSTRIVFASVENTWLGRIFKVITENCMADDLAQRLSKLTFVIFNYDRCVEHFLYVALQDYYGISGPAAAVALSNAHFLHPYGTVGALPWQGVTQGVPFGEELEDRRIVEVAGCIKTFTEGLDIAESDINEIRRAVELTPMLIFLGFAYHKQNLQLLYREGAAQNYKEVYGTALGMSDFDSSAIAHEFKSRHGGEPQIKNKLNCYMLLAEHSRAITFAEL